MGRHSSSASSDAFPARPGREPAQDGLRPSAHSRELPPDLDEPSAQPGLPGPALPGPPPRWSDHLAAGLDWLADKQPTVELAAVPAPRAPTAVEQAEEEHLDWLRHLPQQRTATGVQRPQEHARQDREPPPEPPGRAWAERLVVAMIAAAITLGATRWAGAAWSTSGWIAATVLVVVCLAAWVATWRPGSRRARRRREGATAPEHG